MRRIISILMENQPGAMSRVVDLFSARGYNIETLTVAPTQDPTLSRMTVVTYGNAAVIEQIIKQVNKLIEVFKVIDITEVHHVERELMIIKVRAAEGQREEMKRLADIFRAVVINVTPRAYIIQVTGDANKLDAFVSALGQGVILEIARTGVCGMSRTDK